MRSILAAGAARILRVSRIHRGNGTLTHYRRLRDDGMRGLRGRGSTYAPSASRAPDRAGPHASHPRCAIIWAAWRPGPASWGAWRPGPAGWGAWRPGPASWGRWHTRPARRAQAPRFRLRDSRDSPAGGRG